MGKKILVIEGDPARLGLVEALLEQAGCAVESHVVHAALEVTPDRLASGLAHEVKNPLSAIVMAAKLLRRSFAASSGEPLQLVDAIIKESARLNRSLEEFVRYAQRVVLKPSEQDLTVLTEEALVLVEEELKTAQTRDRFQIRRSFGSVPKLLVDRDQIHYVLTSLAWTMLELMPLGGVLSAAVEAAGATVMVALAGTGEGFEEVAADRAFLPFSEHRREGSGLRLPICRRIVEAHGGRIWLESARERGTAFRFDLPIPWDDGAEEAVAGEPG